MIAIENMTVNELQTRLRELSDEKIALMLKMHGRSGAHGDVKDDITPEDYYTQRNALIVESKAIEERLGEYNVR